ncbi:MAG: hypothetical protein HY473_02305 [Candidatus Sungbacteria bacterium]|uniref:Protein translocase subunit SecA n=1 Tax=Candidatus Sungiibacteriota bacterium TaxID=2750080 RepID=A0A932YZ57_9BACT|nr:hypothetical protein [Candidatus Sungbacteria bacterium]
MKLDLWDRIDSWLERRANERTLKFLDGLSRAIAEQRHDIQNYTPQDIAQRSLKLQKEIIGKRRPEAKDAVAAFALASLAVKRILGFFPNATQLAAAILLAEGNIIEMRSGEGKTVVALLAAYWQTLQRRHVDIATTNDYLAERDHHALGLAYGFLGVSAGLVTSRTPRPTRRAEYAKHVTYVANQELGFDYLRDYLATSTADQISGTHDFAIIDEIDSILIDEARTSLIITEPTRMDRQPRRPEPERMREILDIVRELAENTDYTVDYRWRTVALTDQGIGKVVAKLGEDLYTAKDLETMRALWYALYVRVFIRPDKDFIVENNKVILVDEFTGHAMPDRVLFQGLQEAVEMQAGVKPSGEFAINAAITYRNFFKLYRGIAGMTGTADEAREEFYNLYGLRVVPFHPHQGLLRHDLPTLFFRTAEEKFSAMVREAERARREAAPLLIVGRSIAAAKNASQLLTQHSIPHQLLHAAVSRAESTIIEEAGKPGVITVATNMAGRGADIIINESVRSRSGLRVLGLEHNLSRRVDEQLRGRSGRQGVFGETQMLSSLEDELLQAYADNEFWDYAEALAWKPEGVSAPELARGVLRAQDAAEVIASEQRLSLLRFDSVIDNRRNATYALRARILQAPSYQAEVLREVRRILFQERDSAMDRDDLKKLFRWEELSPKIREGLLRFFAGKDPDEIPIGDNASRPESHTAYNEVKGKILSRLDQSWQRYLESVEWLEDWISLTSVAHEDPYVKFTATADRMFHDMRREFAVSALKLIFAIP